MLLQAAYFTCACVITSNTRLLVVPFPRTALPPSATPPAPVPLEWLLEPRRFAPEWLPRMQGTTGQHASAEEYLPRAWWG